MAVRQGSLSTARGLLVAPPPPRLADESPLVLSARESAMVDPEAARSVRSMLEAGPAGAVENLDELMRAGLPQGLPGNLYAVAMNERAQLLARHDKVAKARARLVTSRTAPQSAKAQSRMRKRGQYDKYSAQPTDEEQPADEETPPAAEGGARAPEAQPQPRSVATAEAESRPQSAAGPSGASPEQLPTAADEDVCMPCTSGGGASWGHALQEEEQEEEEEAPILVVQADGEPLELDADDPLDEGGGGGGGSEEAEKAQGKAYYLPRGDRVASAIEVAGCRPFALRPRHGLQLVARCAAIGSRRGARLVRVGGEDDVVEHRRHAAPVAWLLVVLLWGRRCRSRPPFVSVRFSLVCSLGNSTCMHIPTYSPKTTLRPDPGTGIRTAGPGTLRRLDLPGSCRYGV